MSKNLFFMMGSQVVGIVLGFIVNVVIARSLGPAGKGYYDLVFGTAGLLVTFTGLSLASGVFYYASREALHYRQLFGVLLLISLAQAVFGLISLYILSSFSLSDLFLPQQDRFSALWLIPLVILSQQASRFAQILLAGKARFQSTSMRSVWAQVLTTVILVGLFISGTTLPSRFIIASLLVSILSTVMAVREVWSLPLTSNQLFLKEALIYSLPLALGNAIQFLNYKLDIFIVNNYQGVYAVGVYTLAVTSAQMLWLVPNNLATLILNKAAADKEGRWSLEQVALLTRLSLWLSLLLGVGAALFSPLLTSFIYGERFQASVRPLLLLLPGIVLFSVTIILSSQLAGVGKQVYTTIVAAIAFVITLVLDLLFIPRYGASGAAIASTCSYTLSMLLTWYYFKRVYPIARLSDFILLQRQDVFRIWAYFQRTVQRMGAH